MLQLFRLFVIAHITSGAIGLLSFWIPVIGRKGGVSHRRFGRVFTYAMLATGTAAIGISTCTILAPVETHPHLEASFGAALIRGIFGWMMLYLATLTINLAWYGRLCAQNGRAIRRNREWRNLALQAVLAITTANCAWQGWMQEQYLVRVLMMGISFVGFATVVTNLHFLYRRQHGPMDWLKEHIKGLVGAGISVYTAFMAFGAVRTFPALALHPVLWAVPLTGGLSLILYHHYRIDRESRSRRAALADA
jgi:hypothetical protein